jgi:tRNA (cytidine/uridine-2'-O-)-methyltransferase
VTLSPHQTTGRQISSLRPRDTLPTIVLVSPQIPPNTGNVARLCACTGYRLVLVEPLGFSIADKELKRAGLDYWDKVFLKLYSSWDTYVAATPEAKRWLFTARAERSLWDVAYTASDHLVFGAETTGLSPEILSSGSGHSVTIPMLEERRSLNLSTAVGIAAYEALRQLERG